MALSNATKAARLEARRAKVAPLIDLPKYKQDEIAAAVAAPEPPPKHIFFGNPGDRRPMASMTSRAWYEWHWTRGIDPDARRRLDPALRASVIARDGYTCQLCNGPVDPADVHIDHITPWSKGGKDQMSNLQVSHSRCNIAKGASVVQDS